MYRFKVLVIFVSSTENMVFVVVEWLEDKGVSAVPGKDVIGAVPKQGKHIDALVRDGKEKADTYK